MQDESMNNSYLQWHHDQCDLMKSWPKVTVAVKELRQAVVRFSLLGQNGTGDIVKQWDRRLDPVYSLLSEIEQETGIWYEDTVK